MIPLVHAPGQLATLAGCQRGRGEVPCGTVPIGGPGVRCRRCGTVTLVSSPVVGPRLMDCDCGPPVICLHPVPGSAVAR